MKTKLQENKEISVQVKLYAYFFVRKSQCLHINIKTYIPEYIKT